MKKILVLLLCMTVVLTFAACGKKDNVEVKPNEATSIEQNAEEKKAESAEKESTDTGKSADEDTKETEVEEPEPVVIESAEDLNAIVEEFNETDDEERKEELRKELEKIFAQAEAAAAKGQE